MTTEALANHKVFQLNWDSPSQHFWPAFLVCAIPSFASGALVHYLFPEWKAPFLDLSEKPLVITFTIINAIIISPLIETYVLTWPTVITRQAIQNKWLASFAGALLIIALHAFAGWQKCLGVAWNFTWQAYCFISLTEAGKTYRYRYFFIAGMHIAFNSLCVLVYLLAES